MSIVRRSRPRTHTPSRTRTGVAASRLAHTCAIQDALRHPTASHTAHTYVPCDAQLPCSVMPSARIRDPRRMLPLQRPRPRTHTHPATRSHPAASCIAHRYAVWEVITPPASQTAHSYAARIAYQSRNVLYGAHTRYPSHSPNPQHPIPRTHTRTETQTSPAALHAAHAYAH